MTQNLLLIAIRVAALLLGVNVLQNLPGIFTNYHQMKDIGMSPLVYWLSTLPNLALLLFCLLLWYFPKLMTKGVVAYEAVEEKSISKSSAHFLFAAVGLYIFCLSLPDLVFFVVLKQTLQAQFGATAELDPNNQAALVASIVECVIGLLVFIGHKGLFNLVQRARRAN